MSRFLLLAFCTLTLALMGCSDENGTNPSDDPKNTFRVDGNGYSNVLITTTADGVGSFAAEESDGQETIGVVLMQGVSGQDVYSISIGIDEPTAKTFTISQIEGVGLSLTIVKSSNQSQPEIYFANGGTITVTEWGGVGGTARGTFEVTAVITPSMDRQITVKGNFELEIRD